MTSKRMTVVAVGCSILVGLVVQPSAASPPGIRGVAFGHYTDMKGREIDRRLRELRKLGASHVSFIVQWSTDDVRSASIAPRANHTTADSVVFRMLRRANILGLKAILFPVLDVRRRKPLEWRGTIKPANWDTWWRHYSQFILHYARIAKDGKAAVFCVGSELVSTEHMRERWHVLIQRVRDRFDGKLLYSANWDHYKPVRFWDLVDWVGMTTYYQIANGTSDTIEQMVGGWTSHKKAIVEWSQQIKRPVVFTEVGYPSIDGGAKFPWDYTQSTPIDLEEQRRAYEAFVRVWDGSPALSGAIFWDWYGIGGTNDRSYTARGKPAANVIQRWFTGSVPSTIRKH